MFAIQNVDLIIPIVVITVVEKNIDLAILHVASGSSLAIFPESYSSIINFRRSSSSSSVTQVMFSATNLNP